MNKTIKELLGIVEVDEKILPASNKDLAFVQVQNEFDKSGLKRATSEIFHPNAITFEVKEDPDTSNLPLARSLHGYEELTPNLKYRADSARKILAIADTIVDLSTLDKSLPVLDFGCGDGGSAIYLNGIGFKVIAVDKSTSINSLKAHESDSLQIVNGNGIKLMQEMEPGSISMATAFMIGPDILGTLVEPFIRESLRIVKPGGIVLMQSDRITLETAVKTLEKMGIEYEKKDSCILLKA